MIGGRKKKCLYLGGEKIFSSRLRKDPLPSVFEKTSFGMRKKRGFSSALPRELLLSYHSMGALCEERGSRRILFQNRNLVKNEGGNFPFLHFSEGGRLGRPLG